MGFLFIKLHPFHPSEHEGHEAMITDPHRRSTPLLLALLLILPASAAFGQPYRNRDNKNPTDSAEGLYPIPYQMPTKAEIVEHLNRVHAFLEATAKTEVIDSKTGQAITDLANPVA